MRRASRLLAAAVTVCALLGAGPSTAGRPTLAECFEASDFIANAARARDAGMSEAAFLGRMEDDFELIQSFPNDLRWFVHDADDEAFLLASAREVFAIPSTPESHRQLFLQACVNRMTDSAMAAAASHLAASE
jgi:hypothetical protein